MKILIIEDEITLREEVYEWLNLEGYVVFSASDGIAGVNEAFRCQPDLIICDITMPRLDGYGVLLELKANPSTSTIPFIFVTAKASHDDIRHGMSLGADDYIIKPFTRLELLEAIQARIEKKLLIQQLYDHELEGWKEAFEHEREKRLLKSKLVAMFSHDFRNPLSSILSSIGIVRDYWERLDTERRLKHLKRAEASAQQLLQMLDDMLVISQIETGNLPFKPEPLNISRLLKTIVEEFQAIHAETSSITFTSQVADIINADSRLLRQIIYNLLSNAIKYSPSGAVAHVLLEREHTNIKISVRDQGIGIPEKDQDHLFNAFHRASNVGDIAGTGLGLAIVKQAVELHGGNIEVESTIGIGTLVTIKFPIDLTGLPDLF